MDKRIVIKKWKIHRGFKYLLQCLICNKHFEKSGFRYNNGEGKYCCRQCSGKSKIGKIGWAKGTKHTKFHHWNGGRTFNSQGYILLYKPDHPFCNSSNYVREHHLVAEKILGRHLTREERIHHINEIKTDNRPENLYLFSSNSEHSLYHKLKNKKLIIKSNLISQQ